MADFVFIGLLIISFLVFIFAAARYWGVEFEIEDCNTEVQ